MLYSLDFLLLLSLQPLSLSTSSIELFYFSVSHRYLSFLFHKYVFIQMLSTILAFPGDSTVGCISTEKNYGYKVTISEHNMILIVHFDH